MIDDLAELAVGIGVAWSVFKRQPRQLTGGDYLAARVVIVAQHAH